MWFFSQPKIAVLMVCSANICRSPMAAGVMRAELERRGLQNKIRVDSAGTHATQVGHRADARARRVCVREGINLDGSQARQVTARDFSRFDYLLAMDSRNYEWLVNACPETHRYRISMLGAWGENAQSIEIPDPYFGNEEGFRRVFGLLQILVHAFVTARLANRAAEAGQCDC